MSSIIRNFLFFNIIFILSTADLLAKDLNKIIAAKVNNHIISAQDVLNAVNTLPKNVKTKPLSEIYPRIINELINKHLITKRAYNEKLDLDQNVLNLIQKNKDSILAKYWLNNYIQNETSEKNIKNFYNEYVKSFQEYTEVNASHILVKTKNEAVSIINKLKKNKLISDVYSYDSMVYQEDFDKNTAGMFANSDFMMNHLFGNFWAIPTPKKDS